MFHIHRIISISIKIARLLPRRQEKNRFLAGQKFFFRDRPCLQVTQNLSQFRLIGSAVEIQRIITILQSLQRVLIRLQILFQRLPLSFPGIRKLVFSLI